MLQTIIGNKTTDTERTYARFTCKIKKIFGINYILSIYSSGTPRSRVTLITYIKW